MSITRETGRRAPVVATIVVLTAALLVGCATTRDGVPTSTAASTPAAAATPTPTPPPTTSTAFAEADQRAQDWLASTPIPPGATAVENSPTDVFAQQWQGWVCTPTATVIGYWTVDGMSPGEALNWMLVNPTPGLVLTRSAPVTSDEGSGVISMGATPAGENLEGIAFTYAPMPDGAALRAEVGAVPSDAVCPTPPGGGSWGRPGEG